nr:MAG TPA: hypothetical protein [Caudoviricetes sp.]
MKLPQSNTSEVFSVFQLLIFIFAPSPAPRLGFLFPNHSFSISYMVISALSDFPLATSV